MMSLRHGSLMQINACPTAKDDLEANDSRLSSMTRTTTAIYEPPNEGLPYLVVTFTPDRINVSTANSGTAAREIAADHSIRRRRDKLIALAKGSLPGDRYTANGPEGL